MLGLPLGVERFLLIGEEGVYLLVGVAVDFAFGATVGGGGIAEAVEGDVAVDEDDLHLGDLVVREIQLLLQHFELMDGLFGGVWFFVPGVGGVGGLGVDGDAESDHENNESEGSLHV